MGKQRALANKERQFLAQRLSRMGRALLLSLATLLSFVALGLVIADRIYQPDTFVISQLKIVGKFRHLNPVDVEEALVELDLGNFFSVELSAVKEKVESVPWVQSVDVRREWPNTLELNVIEQRPVMRWGEDRWVNVMGDVISLPEDVVSQHAVTLHGEEQDAYNMLQKAVDWRKRLRASGLELRSLTLSGSQAWTLSLFDMQRQTSFDLLLGRDEVGERLARFQNLYDKQFRLADKQLKRVDARYPDGLAVIAEDVKPSDAVAATDDYRG